MSRITRFATAALTGVLAVALAPLAPVHAASSTPATTNPWLKMRVMDMAHAGGEIEAPTDTMYAFKRAVKLGADMLELDVQSTKDNRLVVMHNATVDGTTNGTGLISDLTLKEAKALDDAYWFVPGVGATHDAKPKAYTLRGIRTGDKPVPKGYKRSDFALSTLNQVFKQFPHMPINIEIKGTSDSDLASYERTGTLLANLLNRTGRTDVIVVSFNDEVTAAFHELAPQIGTAPGTKGVSNYVLAGIKPPEGTVALQVPVKQGTFKVVTPEFVKKAHADGYAVHVWFDPGNGKDNRKTYEAMIDAGVDGLMDGRPTLLEKIFRQRKTHQPPKDLDPTTGKVTVGRTQAP